MVGIPPIKMVSFLGDGANGIAIPTLQSKELRKPRSFLHGLEADPALSRAQRASRTGRNGIRAALATVTMAWHAAGADRVTTRSLKT